MTEEWDTVSLTVKRIANGYLVTEAKHDDYRAARSDPLFYPNMVGVKRELLIRLDAALAMEIPADAGPDF